jgi:acetate kinase
VDVAARRFVTAAAADILVVNAGSTSLKLHVVDPAGRSSRVESLDQPPGGLAAVAHRVVHGGAEFTRPTLIDDAVRARIRALEPLAPLHNGPALRGIDGALEALPDVPQVAVFDTAFHASMPEPAAIYAVPADWREWGVRRYGFHGLSVAWSAERAPQLIGLRPGQGRLAVCHLGGGCSVTAVRDGRSMDTSMGFSPLEGVPMATRSGSVDPSVLLYVQRQHGLDVDGVERALNHESGLAGLAGAGGVLEAERAAAGGDAAAELALEVLALRVAGAVGAMAVAAGGLDAVVFTAGAGERSAGLRDRVCGRLAHLGVRLDPDRNAAATADADISADGAAVRTLVVTAREELVAARAARELLAERPGQDSNLRRRP